MADTLLTGAFVSTFDNYIAVVQSFTTIVVTDAGTPFGDFQGVTDNTLHVFGKAVSKTDAGVHVDSASINVRINVASHGKLVGLTDGVHLEGAGGGVDNAGHIGGSIGILAAGDAAVLSNSAVVHGNTTGIAVTGTDTEIDNSGKIVGGGAGIVLDDGTTLVNDGLIVGKGGTAVMGSSGDEVVLNGGVIRGDVLLGDGSDNYIDVGTGRIIGKLDVGAGDDGVVGNNGDERFHGGLGDDGLFGHGGNDRLFGDDGKDRLFGGAGDDRLMGGAGDDSLVGGSGHDKLWGGGGADQFFWAPNTLGNGIGGDRGVARVMDWVDGTDRINVGYYDIAAMDQATFVADHVTNKHGNAIVHMPSDPANGLHAGKMIILGAAHMIDISDFNFALF